MCSLKQLTSFTPLHHFMALPRHPGPPESLFQQGQSMCLTLMSCISMTSIQGMDLVFFRDNKHIDVFCIPSQFSAEI